MRLRYVGQPAGIEPVAGRSYAAALGIVHAEFREQRILPHLLLALEKVGRGVDDDVERRGAAQFAIDDLHAAVDLGGFLEVIDEAVLHREKTEPGHAEQGEGGGEGEDAGAVCLDLLCEEVGDPVRQVAALMRIPRCKEHQGGRQEREHQQERDHDPDSHHPAEVDHWPDAAGEQRSEGDHRRYRGVEARHRLAAHHPPHQDLLLRVGRLLVHLAIADHQVDREGQRQDQQQRHEIG